MTSLFSSAVVLAAFTLACGNTSLTEIGGPGDVRCQTLIGSPVPAVGSGGGQVPVPIVAARECVWSAASETAWLQVTPLSGQGETVLTLMVAENRQQQPRTGSFLLNEQRFQVTQAASTQGPPPEPEPPPPSTGCTYALDSTSRVFGSHGGEGSFRVITGEGCAWAAIPTNGWITVTSGLVRTGPGEVRYRVESFNGRERTGAIIAAGRTHTITQRRDDDDD